MMLRHSWWDKAKWGHPITGTKMNPFWPYTHSRMVFYPDFSNHLNRAENYEENSKPVPVLPVFNKYLLLAADQLEAGLQSYRKAALRAPGPKQAGAIREVQVAEQMQRMLRSNQAILEFEDLRFKLSKVAAAEEEQPILDRMSNILAAEIQRTEASLVAAERDSRLGYEFEQDYVYTPYVLEEKLRLLRKTLEEQLPAYQSLFPEKATP